MKKILMITGIVFFISFSLLNSGGKAGYTGSPVSSGTCGSCHAGGIGNTTVNIQANPSFVNGTYQPNMNYRISVTVQNQNYSHFGFACEILDSLNQEAGVMSNPGPGVKLANSPAGIMNATHNAVKSGSGSATFEFDWQSPQEGDVTFYVGANAVNGNGSVSGDKPTTFSYSIFPEGGNLIVEKKEDAETYIVYPNPLVGKRLFVKTGRELEWIQLTDMNGKHYPLVFSKNDHWYEIDVEKIPQGCYLLHIYERNQKAFTRKIIIQR